METMHLEAGATARWFPGSSDGPTIVTVPAMGVPAAPYKRFAQALQERGVTVVTADYRGQGESRVPLTKGSDWGYAELAEDLRQVIAHVRAERPGKVVLACHSLGGQVAAALEAQAPRQYDGLVLAASGTPYWRVYRGRDRLAPLGYGTLFAAMGRVQGVFEGERFGFGRQPARLMREWRDFARTGVLPLGTPTPRTFPLLGVTFAGDTYAPPMAMADLVRRFGSEETQLHHLQAPSGHAGWLRDPGPLADLVVAWGDW